MSYSWLWGNPYHVQGRIQDLGEGGSDKYIHNWGEGFGGALIALPYMYT